MGTPCVVLYGPINRNHIISKGPQHIAAWFMNFSPALFPEEKISPEDSSLRRLLANGMPGPVVKLIFLRCTCTCIW